MRVLVATDAWHPQVNGVVRTLDALERSVAALGGEIVFLSPDGFPRLALPTYPDLHVALPDRREIARRIEAERPDVIHVATEGPIGLAVRAYCRRNGLPFTTSFHTKFPEYIKARFGIPEAWSYLALRRFHAGARVTMVSTGSLVRDLRGRGFRRLGLWTRGVDTELFSPEPAFAYDLPRPIFLNVGRIAVEKNLPAFLSLDLPGSKVVIGSGPQEAELRARFPQARFLGEKQGRSLAAHMAGADVFVFPSLTDTYGIVQLEALACGLPVAAHPVPGPQDVIGGHPVGVLDADLRAACLGALRVSRTACRSFALTRTWDASARQFLRNACHGAIRQGSGAAQARLSALGAAA